MDGGCAHALLAISTLTNTLVPFAVWGQDESDSNSSDSQAQGGLWLGCGGRQEESM
jgi:hypothetical protein